MNTAQQTGYEADLLTPGSFLIERYVATSPGGAKVVQWCVHRVSHRRGLEQLTVCDTRRQAARFIEGLS